MSLKLAYYADDFTGSTDALEMLTRAGVKSVLFIDPPTADELKRHPHVEAIGVAGCTRALLPDEMERELRLAFEALKRLEVERVHYKVCSTFDSSPRIGSIGRAIEVGLSVFGGRYAPLLVGAPALGRYCAFGNLFARMGIGSNGAIHRLDRHPSMSRHPVTPADESDLRRHLAEQTSLPAQLIDVVDLEGDRETCLSKLNGYIDDQSRIVLFDAVNEQHLRTAAELIESTRKKSEPLFLVGSSGVEMALGMAWTRSPKSEPAWPKREEACPMLALSGSCSPVTEGQLCWALENGFVHVPLDVAALATGEHAADAVERAANEAIAALSSGANTLVTTALGARDERVESAKFAFARRGILDTGLSVETSRIFGAALGEVARRCFKSVDPLGRLIVAGGDTSSYAARAMGIEALEMIAPLAPGAPLCRALASGSPLDGAEVCFKGGQVGSREFFGFAAPGDDTGKGSRSNLGTEDVGLNQHTC